MKIHELFDTVHCPICGEPAQEISEVAWRCDDCGAEFALSPQVTTTPEADHG